MPWIKLDDQWMRHPKIIRAGRDARDMWLASLTWCAEYLTDGHVPEEALPTLAVMAGIDVANCQSFASKLLDVCLWERTDNGYYIHDYTDYNPTKEQSEAIKNARSEAGRAGGIAKASKTPSKLLAKDKQNPAPSPSPLKDLTGADAPKEPPAVEEPAQAPSIIKNQGAYNALMQHEQARRNGKPDVSWLSEHLRPLAEMFITESSIVPLKGEHKFWIRSIGNLYDIGAKPDHIKKAIRKMRGDGLTIKSPESCLANIRDELARSVQPDNINWK